MLRRRRRSMPAPRKRPAPRPRASTQRSAWRRRFRGGGNGLAFFYAPRAREKTRVEQQVCSEINFERSEACRSVVFSSSSSSFFSSSSSSFFSSSSSIFFSFLNPDQLHRLPPFSDFERGRRQTTSAGTSERVRVRAGTTSSTPLSFSPRGREEVEKKKKKKKRAQERVKNFHHPRPPPSCSPLLESLHGAEEERQGRESRAREERVPFFAERQEVSVFRLQRRESEKQEEKK